MKKNTIKAFTLVEMLIVIVIIGILIASLMPRMQSAQGRARDVARKNDLAQIQTAIITSQQDKGYYPGMKKGACAADGSDCPATLGAGVSTIGEALKTAGMTQVPKDPNASNSFKGIMNDASEITDGDYGYLVTTRNAVDNGGFVLMAKTEVEGGSNRVTCDTTTKTDIQELMKNEGHFKKGVDLKDIVTCSSFTKNENGTCLNNNGTCTYKDESELRYILVY